MRFQLSGEAIYEEINECAYSAPDLDPVSLEVKSIKEDFEAETWETAINIAKRKLGYLTLAGDIVKHPKKCCAELREYKLVATLEFKPGQLEEPPRPKRVIPARRGRPAVPARIEVRKL